MTLIDQTQARVKPGDRCERWTVLGVPFYVRRADRRKYVVCECDCGNVAAVAEADIASHKSKSCGCRQKEVAAGRNWKHGATDTRLFSIWKGMHKRCSNPNSSNWHNYGHKGIRVCQEWPAFLSFQEWAIRNGYTSTSTIDRKDNNSDYSPENCRWIPKGEQTRNTCRNIYLTAFGETKLVVDWLSDPRTKVSRFGLMLRLRRGMPAEDALTRPSRNKKKRQRKPTQPDAPAGMLF